MHEAKCVSKMQQNLENESILKFCDDPVWVFWMKGDPSGKLNIIP